MLTTALPSQTRCFKVISDYLLRPSLRSSVVGGAIVVFLFLKPLLIDILPSTPIELALPVFMKLVYIFDVLLKLF